MKVVLSSNAMFAGTGYGVQAKGIINHVLLPLGHEVVHHAWYGLEGAIIQAGPVKIYPKIRHAYGDDSDIVARSENADLLITLQDVWVLSEDFASRLPCPWLGHFPIDGDPVPPPVLTRARQMAYPVVYTRHASRLLDEAGLPHTFVRHGIDTDMYCPGDKREAREVMELPQDAFIVSMVAANKGYPSRKSFPEAIQAFARFYGRHRDAILYLHTERHSRGSGLNLEDVLRAAGLPETAYKFVNQVDYLLGIPEEYLAQVYRGSDVLLSPSMGEGFGLPIAEAQACGCPVITTAVTSMPEITINGIAVDPLQNWYSPLGHWQYVADITAVSEAIGDIYGWSADTARRKAGVEFFQQAHSWDVVREQCWRPLLERIAADLGKETAVLEGAAVGELVPA